MPAHRFLIQALDLNRFGSQLKTHTWRIQEPILKQDRPIVKAIPGSQKLAQGVHKKHYSRYGWSGSVNLFPMISREVWFFFVWTVWSTQTGFWKITVRIMDFQFVSTLFWYLTSKHDVRRSRPLDLRKNSSMNHTKRQINHARGTNLLEALNSGPRCSYFVDHSKIRTLFSRCGQVCEEIRKNTFSS